MRNRLTWNTRTAASAPALPGMEGTVDADVSKLVKGGPEEFGEGVSHAPITQSAAPALPGYEALQAAMDAGVVPEMSHAEIMAVEKKASKCLRIAKAMLGKTASAESIEAQALDFMDLADGQIDSTLTRVANMFLAEDVQVAEKGEVVPEGDKVAEKGEVVPEGDKVAEKGKVPEVPEVAALAEKVARLERVLGSSLVKEASLDKTADDMLSEMLLESMLKEAKGDEDDEDDEGDEGGKAEKMELADMAAMLGVSEAEIKAAVAAAKPKAKDEDEAEAEAEAGAGDTEKVASDVLGGDIEAGDDLEHSVEAGDLEHSVEAGDLEHSAEAGDALGMDEGPEASADATLASLFAEDLAEENAAHSAAVKDQNLEGTLENSASFKEASIKTAGLRPQPRKASTGAKTLGAVTKVASSNELDDLSKLWESAPDVSEYFNSSKWGV